MNVGMKKFITFNSNKGGAIKPAMAQTWKKSMTFKYIGAWMESTENDIEFPKDCSMESL